MRFIWYHNMMADRNERVKYSERSSIPSLWSNIHSCHISLAAAATLFCESWKFGPVALNVSWDKFRTIETS